MKAIYQLKAIDNWEYPDSFKPKTHSCLLTVTTFLPENALKSRKLLFQNPNIDHVAVNVTQIHENVYFSKFLRKIPRRAKPIPTAGENPLLINDFENENLRT